MEVYLHSFLRLHGMVRHYVQEELYMNIHDYCTITWSAYRPVDFLYGSVQKRVREFCEEGRNLNVLQLIMAD
jgi:hypothetical protein